MVTRADQQEAEGRPSDDPEMRVSHETIYECLYLQARGTLRTALKIALRQGRARRVPRSRAASTRGKIKDMVNILSLIHI